MLKSSIFGGYNKRDVNQYVDSVVEENEKKARDLEEQIDLLTKENFRLKNQLVVEKKKRPGVTGGNSSAEGQLAHAVKQSSFQLPVDKALNREGLSIRQQMDLPEGTYLVSKDHGIMNLPEPSPVYRTKEKNPVLNLRPGLQDEVSSKMQGEETNPSFEGVADRVAAAGQMDSNRFPQDGSGMESSAAEGYKTIQKNAADGKYGGTKSEYRAEFSAPDSLQSEEIAELQSELVAVRILLEKEKREKQKLAAKLEFSNDLLLQLYQK